MYSSKGKTNSNNNKNKMPDYAPLHEQCGKIKVHIVLVLKTYDDNLLNVQAWQHGIRVELWH